MRERGHLIRTIGVSAVQRLLEQTAPPFGDSAVGASDGAGSAARVPWIRVHSERMSPNPTVGWYVVYLFAADGSAVYLSLNQGTTLPGFRVRSRGELAERVAQARRLTSEVPLRAGAATEITLDDRGGLGGGYERGNVVAFRYEATHVPEDEALAEDLASMLVLLNRLYLSQDDLATDSGGRDDARPSVTNAEAFVAWAQSRYGPSLVASRRAAEDEARELLDAYAGQMSREQATQLFDLFSRGSYGEVMRHNRFSPAFVGHAKYVIVDQLDSFNEWTARIWTGDEAQLAVAVDQILKDPTTLRGAGRSYPTMLAYLRDPERYTVWLQLTHLGLAALTAFAVPRSRGGGWDRYLQYCNAARDFAEAHRLEPQEVDAVLSEAGRAAKVERAAVTLPSDLPPHEGEVDEESSYERHDLTEVALRTHLPIETIEEWAALLNGRMRQALLYGPPGTGKTWVASQLALHLAGSPDRVALAQFHPSFAYEDFIEGLRPQLQGNAMTYEVRKGLFAEFCIKAAKSRETFVFVIDELNRADVGSVLGELMLLLEYRGRTVRLPYSQDHFLIPSNVVVLATMNTADRSLALVDFAMRRRFHAIEMLPARDVLKGFLDARAEDFGPVLEMFDLVQARVADPNVAPGHSYWMRDELAAADLERIWRYELKPYLAEYWFENQGALSRLDADIAALLAEDA